MRYQHFYSTNAMCNMQVERKQAEATDRQDRESGHLQWGDKTRTGASVADDVDID